MKKLISSILTIFVFFGNRLPQKCIQTTVDFLGQTQSICVSDSTAIRILWGAPPNDILAFDHQLLDNQLLHKISQQYSLDVATIYALNRLYEIPQNKNTQDKYLSVIDWNMTAVLESVITCPECGHQKKEIMPIEACQFFLCMWILPENSQTQSRWMLRLL